jgi:hypothetical protein
MNIVTIMNYDFNDRRNVVMCLMWAHSVYKASCGNARIVILTEKSLPAGFVEMLKKYNAEVEICPNLNSSLHHNYRFKLYNLCHLDYPFIFIDCDILVMGNLQYLWDRKDDKPWIGIDHQLNIPGHTGKQPFLNSGVQIVGDPAFYDFDRIIKVASQRQFKYDVPGKDQAAIWTYFKSIGYDYTHPEIGTEWNACAGFSRIEKDDLSYWKGETFGLDNVHRIYVNHYWWDYKPWLINCPAYAWYDEYFTGF